MKLGRKVRVVKAVGCPFVGQSGIVMVYRPAEVENRDTILGAIVHVAFPGGVWVFHPDHGDVLEVEEWSSEERMALNVAKMRLEGFDPEASVKAGREVEG